MKNVKLILTFAMFIVLVGTSCRKNDDFYSYEDDEFGDFDDEVDGGFDDTDDDDGDFSGDGDGSLTLYKIAGNDIIKVKDFEVSNNLKSFQADSKKHQEMWDFFKKLIPENERGFITEFIVFHGSNGLAGYVTPIDQDDLSAWRMGLAIDLADELDAETLKDEFAYTSIHEFGHVLTLNNTQVDANVGENGCSDYHTGEGCSNVDSYINRIYEIGWADIMNEFNNLPYEDAAERIYNKYPDRFVTDYAASNPGEDVAEVFSVFVVSDDFPRGNTIADQKVKAMYEFPELVQLRNQIRKAPVVRALKSGSWAKKEKKRKCGHKSHQHKTKSVRF